MLALNGAPQNYVPELVDEDEELADEQGRRCSILNSAWYHEARGFMQDSR